VFFAIVFNILIPVFQFCTISCAYSTEACHPFHVKAATQTMAKLPPVGA
jgi:hypothetical protein